MAELLARHAWWLAPLLGALLGYVVGRIHRSERRW